MANGMRIEGEQIRRMPLNMQEQVAMALVKNEKTEKGDRIDVALSELVEALMEKYPCAISANIAIEQGTVRISVNLLDMRTIHHAEM